MQYVVSLWNPRYATTVVVYDHDSERELAPRCANHLEFEVSDVNDNQDEVYDLGTWLFNSEEEARLFGELLAKEKPGYEVIISKSFALYTTPRPRDVSRKVINEQGVLPE